jgi:hypothetical protein
MTTAELAYGLDALKQIEGSMRRQKLEYIAELERRQVWVDDGAKDMARWVAARCDETHWRSRRWVDAAQAIEALPKIRGALALGVVSLDKVCELTRFATPETEAGLVTWAASVSLGTVKRKADRATAEPIEETRADDCARYLSWWYEDDRRLHLEAMLPSEQGGEVIKALERLADRLPFDPDSERGVTVDERRADALVALASQAISDDPDSARARVNLHVDLAALVGRDGSGVIESGGVVHPELASLLSCDSIVQAIVHGDGGHTVGIGRASRTVPEWLYRQLRERDGSCTFPGCHHRRYVKAHHIRFWEWGGPTDLDNLVLVCGFHHKLIHLHNWRVELGKQAGVVHWFRPDYEPFTICPPGGWDSEPFARRGAAELRRSPEPNRTFEPNRAPPDGPAEVDAGLSQAELVGA